MKRLSHAKRRDANEPQIVRALEAVGASVERLDVFDLLVGYRRRDFKLEVKSEEGDLNDAQKAWIEHWQGAPPVVVRTWDEALRAIGALED